MSSILRLLVVAGSCLLIACASRTSRIGTTEVTSAEILSGHREGEAAAVAITRGLYQEALAHAERAVQASPQNAWARYNLAVALRDVGHIEAAVGTFREAEKQFEKIDRRGKALCIYGRARAFNEAGRCGEARVAYQEYAAFVHAFDEKAADMALAYAQQCRAIEADSGGDLAMTEAVAHIMSSDYAQALVRVKEVGDPGRDSGWFAYNRAIALAGLARTDDAVTVFKEAEARFGVAGNDYGRAISIYGRARALDNANRCREARQTYGDYAEFVRPTSVRAADMAAAIGRACSAR